MAVDDDAPLARRRKMYATAKRYGLSRADRLSLAETLLWCDVRSWADLTDEQVVRVLDALEGFALVTFLLTDQLP